MRPHVESTNGPRHRGLAVVACLCFASPSVATAGELVVPRDYPTIQSAIDAARPGATVAIEPGTYVEALVLAKDLTLTARHSGFRPVVIRSPAAITPFAFGVRSRRPHVAVVRIGEAAKVTLSRLTIAGPVPCGPSTAGLFVVGGAEVRLRDVRVTGIRPDASCPRASSSGNAIRVGFAPDVEMDGVPGSTGSLDARGVLVDGFYGDGILALAFADTRTNVRIEDSVVTGAPRAPGLWQAGIIVVGNMRAIVRENVIGPIYCTVDFCGDDLVLDAQGSAIGTGDLSGYDNRIDRNFAFGTDVGLWPAGSPGCCSLDGNVVDARLYGIVIQDADYVTRRNVLLRGKAGIVANAVGADASVMSRGDVFAPRVDEPLKEIECCGFRATAVPAPRGSRP